ncbi:hypothetical protein CBR_g45531 [Chara braunii]|uniref:Uncharacterized protein n=1 Tax=Chara braunii TaxID=69332 RepID=A0A388LYZ2_CHABU|nr:hypothetical protein CBR_g45531 [Chara braunii]|eukprot:GBG87473.1 hypothetical protein CBR_g45531 [Chara braunii]
MSGARGAPTVKTVRDIVGRMVARIEECRHGWCSTSYRPSTSYDTRKGRSASPRRTENGTCAQTTTEADLLQKQIEELNKSLASVSEFVQCEKAGKAEEERLKRETEEEKERKAAEKRACEKKECKRVAKLQKEVDRDAEMNKRMELQLAIKTSDFFYRMEANLGLTLELVQRKAKKQVERTGMHSSEHEGSDSATEEICTRTGHLTINEKQKRGPELVFDDSPYVDVGQTNPETDQGDDWCDPYPCDEPPYLAK